MKKIIDKLFCLHKWAVHEEHKREWEEKQILDGTQYWHAPVIMDIKFSSIKQVLICEHCGKIKEINL